jgi:hypothetical protein
MDKYLIKHSGVTLKRFGKSRAILNFACQRSKHGLQGTVSHGFLHIAQPLNKRNTRAGEL